MSFPRLVKTILKAAVSLSLLSYLYFRCDIPRLRQALGSVRPGYFLLALACTALFAAISTARFRVILRDHAQLRIPFFSLLRIYLTGLFFSYFTPGGISGDAVRVAKLNRGGGKLPSSIQSIILERGLGFLALLTLSGPFLYREVALKNLPAQLGWVLICISIGGYAAVFFLLGGFKWKLPLPASIQSTLAAIRPRTVVYALLISFLLQGVNLLTYFMVSQALRVDLAFSLVVPAILLSSACAMLPISIQGLGVSEGIFAKMLSAHGLPVEKAVLFSLLIFLTGLSAGLVGGVLYGFERD